MSLSKAMGPSGLAGLSGRMALALLLCAACCCGAYGVAGAQTLEEKLGASTDFLPKESGPVERLVEVARKFRLPMAIEWVERAGDAATGKPLPARKRSVRELIEEIASASPEQRVETEGGLLRVYSPEVSEHPFNFLNITLRSYSVTDGDLFEAEDQLRWAIRFALEPQKYAGGYGGGYGHGGNDIFEIPKFSLSCSNVTVREALNRIALAQGNALWVATLRSADLDGRAPRWKRQGADGGDLPVTSAWRFLPLAGISDLAREQVAVDVTVAGLLDQRMTTIPVMAEAGLMVNTDSNIGGATSEGDGYDYSVSVVNLEKESMTLSIHLTVRRRGQAEFRLTRKLKVKRGEVTELAPQPGISIRAYFEPRGEGADDDPK